MEHSRRWQLHIGGSKMFELLFHAGMSVLDQLFLQNIHIIWLNKSRKPKKLLLGVENMPKKWHFPKKIFEWASTKSKIPEMGQPKSGIPEMGQPILGIPEMGQPKSGIPEMG